LLEWFWLLWTWTKKRIYLIISYWIEDADKTKSIIGYWTKFSFRFCTEWRRRRFMRETESSRCYLISYFDPDDIKIRANTTLRQALIDFELSGNFQSFMLSSFNISDYPRTIFETYSNGHLSCNGLFNTLFVIIDWLFLNS